MKNKTTYDKNETMKMLGKQYPNNFFNKEVFKQLDDILTARQGQNIKDICIDVYMLGVINGQRKERARHKNGQGVSGADS